MGDDYLNSLLGEREEILLVTHQHWFQLFRSILFELLLILATIVAVTLVWMFWMPNISSLFGYLLLVIPGFSMLRDILRWRNHKYVITNRRVVQIFGVINKNVTDSGLEKLNDVKMDQSFWGRIFDFGDIEILTASELGINRYTFIGDPVGFKTAMLNAKFKLDEDQAGYAPVTQSIMDIPRLIHDLDDLRKSGLISDLEFEQKKARLLERI